MSDDLKLVKELRDKTGAGFLDCKEALASNDGNLDNAIDFLRKKGLAKASKKSTREANEGAVGFFENNNIGVIIKVNSETDFAAKGDTFLDFIDFLGKAILDFNKTGLDLDSFLNSETSSKTIKEITDEMIAKIGENIIISDSTSSNNIVSDTSINDSTLNDSTLNDSTLNDSLQETDSTPTSDSVNDLSE